MIKYIPGLAGVPATESSISSIDGKNGILTYRGYSIEDLVKYASFEEVSMLLRDGELPDKNRLDNFKDVLHKRYEVKRNIHSMMWSLPATGHPMNVLQTAIAAMATFYPDAGAQNPDSICTQSALTKIISNMSTLVAMWTRISAGYNPIPPSKGMSYAKNFLYMSSGEEPDNNIVKLFDACLILHAEHTINASTFSAMVTASTLANPFASISAAVGTLAGSLHGGANEDVLKMLDEIGNAKNARTYIENRLKNKQIIWGMGHREYSVKDPRANILQNMIESYIKKSNMHFSKRFETALEVERVCEELLSNKGIYPNVDFYSGIVYAEIFKIPQTHFTPIFAMARSSGWTAHWHEQVRHNRIFRPTQIYTGAHFRSYPKK
ncbi:citrate synthase [Candidatus Vesicomyidisocius calyptogenae]|uniref:Citrate synthase n=1 Tax=Vesicomyosocius okutanii subsp. Calyptogena okutanii (strain HA) TaxID=412965 RepID=A5CVH2_VESOH|nr:citrate synthase [Candidatus Vesicomyosocius okutanii]BAF62061.1 citrate synthase [Candidatus Vesicomyosocius okutanii]